MANNNDQYIGGLWNNTSAKGTRFMKGSITIDGVETKMVIFKNGRKKKTTHPDYTIMRDTPLEKNDDDDPFASDPSDEPTGDNDSQSKLESMPSDEEVPF